MKLQDTIRKKHNVKRTPKNKSSKLNSRVNEILSTFVKLLSNINIWTDTEINHFV